MTKTENILIGKLALQEGLLTKEQLYDCLVAQDRTPNKTLGSIMVQRGYLTDQDIDRLLTLQKKVFDEISGATNTNKGSLVFGSLLAEMGLATEYQVNECLRLQGRFREMGIQPLPPLGEIMINRGYLTKENVERALQLQNLFPYPCPECGSAIDLEHLDTNTIEESRCKHCNAEIPFLLAQMAVEVQQGMKKVARTLEAEMPLEVQAAEREEKNHFGKYILVREIGRGGAGIVYKAWQLDLNKYVALKMLLHQSSTGAGIETPFGDAEDLKRFYNEIYAAANLSHPNIVPIYDIDNTDQNFFYTMKFIDGAPLDALIQRGTPDVLFRSTEVIREGQATQKTLPFPIRRNLSYLPTDYSLTLLTKIVHAVVYAHSQGVIHRDIKPQNILVDNDGKPWIMDFGLAKVGRIKDSPFTRGVIIGTPCYMPPEQASGDMDLVDHLSDVYSLGAVLYEMLTGSPPFIGSSNQEILDKVLDEDPPHPLSLNASLPAEVVKIVRRAMDKERSRRYSSAQALADDIDLYLRHGRVIDTTGMHIVQNKSWWEKIKGWFRWSRSR